MIDATGEEGEDENIDKDSAAQCPVRKREGKFTIEQVVGYAIGMLLAGYETTANALAYTSYLLALNPDIQEKLQSEIDSYFDDKPVRHHCVWHLIYYITSVFVYCISIGCI